MADPSDFANPLGDFTPLEQPTNPLDELVKRPDQGDYLANFNQETVLHDPSFLNDARRYYEDRDGSAPADDDELRAKFFQDNTFKRMNSLGIIGDWAGAQGQTSDMNAREARLQTVYQRLPDLWQRGGRGWRGLGENLLAMATDPVNAIPLGEVMKVAQGVKIATDAAMAGRGALASGLAQGVAAGAREAGVMGTIGAAYDAASQERDIAIGAQGSFDWSQLASSAAFQAALAGGPAALGGLWRGTRAGAAVARGLELWPTTRGEEVAKVTRLRESADAAANGDNPEVAAVFSASADKQQAFIDKMDQAARARGTTDEQLGISHEEDTGGGGTADTGSASAVEAANTKTLQDMRDMYQKQGMPNPHLDPNAGDNLVWRKNLSNIEWSLDFDKNVAALGQRIQEINDKPKPTPKDIEAKTAIQTEISARTAVRDGLLKGAPKDAAQMEQAITAQGVPVRPNEGYGVNVYAQPVPPDAYATLPDRPGATAAAPPATAAAGAPAQVMPAATENGVAIPVRLPGSEAPPAAAAPGAGAPPPAPAGAGGGGAGGAAAVAPAPPATSEIATVTARTEAAGAPAPAPAAAPAAKAPKAKATKEATAPIFTPTADWQEAPADFVPGPGVQVREHPVTGARQARLAPHPIAEASVEVVSKEANRIDPTTVELIDEVHNTMAYKYGGKSTPGHLSMTEVLQEVGYDGDSTDAIVAQIRAEAKGVPQQEGNKIKREMLTEAIVAKHIERIEGVLEAAGIESSVDILKAEVNNHITDPKIAAVALNILDGRSRLNFGATEDVPLDNFAEEFLSRHGQAAASESEERGHTVEDNGMSPEQRRNFKKIAREEAEKMMATMSLSMDSRGLFHGQVMQFVDLFLKSSSVPGSHKGRMGVLGVFLGELKERFEEREAGLTSGPAARALGERGAAPGGEARFGNPDNIYKKNPLRPDKRGGIPSVLKQANRAGFIGRNLGKGDVGTVGEAIARSEIEHWQNVRAITLKEGYQTADGKYLKPGDVVYLNPTTKKAYADHRLAGRSRPVEEPQAAGGQTVIPATVSAREAAEAEAAGVDPVKYATRLRDFEPKRAKTLEELESEAGTKITAGSEYYKSKDGRIYRDLAEFRKAMADEVREEPPEEAAAVASAPTPAQPPTGAAPPISDIVRKMALAMNADPAALQRQLIENGMMPEGSVPIPDPDSPPVPTTAQSGPPPGWAPRKGRKLSIMNKETGLIRTLSPGQSTVEDMLSGQPIDNWTIGSNRNDISSGQQATARADFMEAGKEPPPVTEVADVKAAPKVTDPGEMLSTEQARTTPLAQPILVKNASGELVRLNTVLEAAQHLRALHTTPWPATRAEMKALLSDIETLTKATPRVKQPSVTRETARQSLRDLFSKIAPDQLPLALDAIRRIPGVDLPGFLESSAGKTDNTRTLGVASGFGTTKTVDARGNTISGGQIALTDPRSVNAEYPVITILHHELGHWGYDNILTDEDRLSFMTWVHDNFYGRDGKLDMATVNRVAPTSLGGASPQEMFASMFQRWVASNGKSMPVPESLMTKFSSYLSEFLSRWFNQTSAKINRKVEPLFAKIMPDPSLDSWIKTLGSEGRTQEGQALVEGLRSLDRARYNIELGLTSSDPAQIEEGIRVAMRGIDANKGSLGEKVADRLSTRLGNIVRDSATVSSRHDPELAAIKEDFEKRNLNPKEMWDAKSASQRKLLQQSFENKDLVTLGDSVELENGEWTIVGIGADGPNPKITLERVVENGVENIDEYTRNDLAIEGSGHIVPRDEYNLTKLVLSGSEDPVFTAVRAANEAHQVLLDALVEHRAAFSRIEGGDSALRVDNPTELTVQPLGSLAESAAYNQSRLNDTIKALEAAKTTTDMMGLNHFLEAIDDIGRVTGRRGMHKGREVNWKGGVSFLLWREIPKELKAQGRDIVDDAYGAFTDHDVAREALYDKGGRKLTPLSEREMTPEREYRRTVTVTLGTMTDMQRALYNAQIERAQEFISTLYTALDMIRRKAESITKTNIEKGAYVVGQKITTAAQRKARALNVARIAASKRPRAQDEVRGKGGQVPDLPSPKGMSDEQLADAIIEHGSRTKAGLHYGAELRQRDKATPFLPHVRAEEIPNDMVQAGTEKLGAILKAAIESGDKKTADQARWEAFRRSKNSLKKFGIVDTADPTVISSINRETRHTIGEPDNVGVPEGAPALLKDLLSRFTHRKADVQTSLRTTMYRLFNLGGITDVTNRDGMTIGRLYRLAGREVPEHMSATSTLFDIRDPAFSDVRSAMRRLVGNFAEGKGDAGENISNMVEMVLRSGLLEDTEYGAVHDAYDLTSDGVKKTIEGSHDVPVGRRPDAWFADHMADYLMGKRGTRDLFRPEEGKAAPGFGDALREIKVIAERVKDATAYVVNGLMHDDMRREFPALTDYGDVFAQSREDQFKAPPAPDGMEEQGMLNQNAMSPEAPRINAIILNTMVNSDETLALDRLPAARGLIADAAEKGGAGARTGKVIDAGVGGFKKIGGLREVFRYNFGHIYKRVSDLMRSYGMNWWGDKLNPLSGTGLYHKIQVKGADYLMPLYNLGHSMPDAPGRLKNWWTRNQFWKEGTQPPSHGRVVEVLRGMKAYGSLSKPERELHDAYRAMFTRVRNELDDAGVQIGNVGEFYFPQVFNAEAMLRNRDGAINAFATYLVSESRSPTSALPIHLSMAEAREKAADIVDGITNNDGVYMPPKAERRASKADNIDHQRMFNMHETVKDRTTGKMMRNADGSPMMRYAGAYKMLEPFMHSGLEPVATKYFEAAARRIVTTKEIGVNSHGFYDYMHILQGGDEGALERGTYLLSNKKVVRHNFLDRTDDGGFEEATRTIETFHPMSPNEAFLAVRDGVDAMGDGKTKADIQRGIDAVLLHSADKGETARMRAEAVMNGIADVRNRSGRMAGKGLSHDEYARAEGAYRVAMQKPIGAQSNIARKTRRTLLNFNSLTMLGWTTLSSTPDLIYPLIRSGNMGALVRAWTSYAADPTYRAAMRNTGTIIEQLTHDRIGMLHGGEGSKFTRAFFNFNMLTHWDSLVREIGGAVGWEALKAEQARALRAGPGTRAWKQGEARLARYGLDHYLTNGKSLNDPRLLNIEGGDPKVREAIVKFTNECVFTHTPDDIPLWAQTPLGKLAFQLKAFPTMMGRMALGRDGVFHQFGKGLMGDPSGNVMPMIYMLTMGTGTALGANMLKDIIQGRGGDTQDKHELRNRKMSEIAKQFGWKVNIHGPADTFLGNYAESFMMLGGLGYLTDLLYQAGQSADNGAWGYQRFLGGLLGPTADALHIGYEGLATGLYPSTSNERALTGDVLRRVPIFGGVRSIASTMTDKIAGPAPGRQSSGLGAATGASVGASVGQ